MLDRLQIHDLAARRDELDDQLPELAYKLDCLCQKEEFISQIQNVVELQIEELWVEVHCLKQQIEVRVSSQLKTYAFETDL